MLPMQLSFRKLLGEVDAFEVAFFQKAYSFTFLGFFCPFRFYVNK